MDWIPPDDSTRRRIELMSSRVREAEEQELYFYNLPISELRGGSEVLYNGRLMQMFASYSYLGLIGHPRITQAAQRAIERYGTGTHGVRTLAGSLTLHRELEETIAHFKGAEDAVTFSSGYATNLSTISALVGRHDTVFGDKLNHASIVDGCMLSGANLVRFRHRDLDDLEERLQQAPASGTRLVIADAVFSMDGDIIDLPRLSELCKRYGAWLMIDEAHSLGVLGQRGHGIEEHFGVSDVIDIKMGTLSKTIPSVGGYVAGRRELVRYLRHQARAYIFSAALPPAQAAAAMESFHVIEDEPWRVEAVQRNARHFIDALHEQGLDTLDTETAIVPVLCGSDERAFRMTAVAHQHAIFVLPVISPAVQEGAARLRATVTASHTPEQINNAVHVIAEAGRSLGLI
jgi:8-amino-7-oxononanoate synthase